MSMGDEAGDRRNPLERLGDAVSTFAEDYFPDPFIFTLGLTFLAVLIVVGTTDRGPGETAIAWGVGFWSVMQFSLQAALLLLAGWVLGNAAVIRNALRRVATVPKTHMQALVFAVVFGFFFGLLHSAVALIVNSMFARELAYVLESRDIEVHYPLLVAAALVGVAPAGQGVTSVAPLLVASEGHFLEAEIGVIPMTETIFTLPNLLVIVAFFIASLIVVPLLLPPEGKRISRRESSTGTLLADGGSKPVRADGGEVGGGRATWLVPEARRGESRLKSIVLDSPLGGTAIGLALVGYVWYLLQIQPASEVIEINTIITLLLGIGLILNMNLRVYTTFLRNAWGPAGQWLLQFQFYGGIMAIMIWSGLIDQIATLLATYSTTTTFYPLVTFISAIINLLIPSAGGQWIVTGEVLSASATSVGAEHNWTILSFILGDQLTNVVHPFVLIPVFMIAGVSFKHLGGYLVIAFGIFFSISMVSALMFGIFL